MREKEHEMKSTMSKRRKKLVNRKINIVEMAESRLVASKMVFKPSGFLVHQMKCDAGRNAPRFCTPMSFFFGFGYRKRYVSERCFKIYNFRWHGKVSSGCKCKNKYLK